MHPGNRDDIPRRPLNLASGRGGAGTTGRAPVNGAPHGRGPVPLGVNERIRTPHPGTGPRRPSADSPARRNTPGYGTGRPAPRTASGSSAPAPRRPTARLASARGGGTARQALGQQARGTQRGPSPAMGRPLRTPQRPAGARRGIPTRHRNGAYYLHGAPRRREGGMAGALSDPRLLVSIIAIIVIGFGAFTVNAALQRRDERIADEQEAQRQEKLEKQTVKVAKLGPTAIPVSTPRMDWERGTVPYLFQQDPLWSSAPYAGGTIAKNGCGPTSLAMAYIYLTGKTDQDPITLSAFAEDNGHVSSGGTEWSLMDEGARQLGLNVESLPVERGAIERALKEGRPIICNVGPGDFTAVGHYLVLTGIDERGMVSIHDPNSAFNSARSWPIHQLLPQIKNPWAYSI